MSLIEYWYNNFNFVLFLIVTIVIDDFRFYKLFNVFYHK